jgi:ribosomal protein S18 acetylase RimI-like enzyme
MCSASEWSAFLVRKCVILSPLEAGAIVNDTEYTIRQAQSSDAAGLAAVHETTWRETYVGLLSEHLLNALTADARTAAWRQMLAGAPGILSTTYVAERDGGLVAFGSCGEQRDKEFAAAGYPGEFTAVYVLKTDQRRGVGTRLMQAMMGDLAERGLVGFTLWVPQKNIPARSLYEQLGGKLLGHRQVPHQHESLTEVAYGWPKP